MVLFHMILLGLHVWGHDWAGTFKMAHNHWGHLVLVRSSTGAVNQSTMGCFHIVLLCGLGFSQCSGWVPQHVPRKQTLNVQAALPVSLYIMLAIVPGAKISLVVRPRVNMEHTECVCSSGVTRQQPIWIRQPGFMRSSIRQLILESGTWSGISVVLPESWLSDR